MSTMQRISLIGLYDYDETLFDNLTLPEGYDKPTFVNNLLLEHGEKLVLYTNPDFMKRAIGYWSNKWSLELSRIYQALTAEYNPIYNYDRYEESKDKHKATDNPKYTDKQTNDYTITNEQLENSTDEHKISADNSSEYQPEDKNITNFGKNSSLNKGTIQKDIDGTTKNLSEKFKHKAHMYGNIGVTTSASMVTEVVEQRLQYNLYGIATRLFASELLIGIY